MRMHRRRRARPASPDGAVANQGMVAFSFIRQLCRCAAPYSMPQFAPMLHPTSFIALVAGIMASSLVLHAQHAKSNPADSAQPLKGTVKVSLETSKGNIELELDADK